MAAMRVGVQVPSRAGVLEAKGHGRIPAPPDSKVALSSASLPATPPKPQPLPPQLEESLASVRRLCEPGAQLDPAQGDSLQALATAISATPRNGWAAALVDAAGGPFMLEATVERLLAGVTQAGPLADLVIALVDAFGARAIPTDRLVQILRRPHLLAHDPVRNPDAATHLVRRLVNHLGGADMRADLRNGILDALADLPDDTLCGAVKGFVWALGSLVHPRGNSAFTPRLQLPDAATPHLKALFDQVLLRPALEPGALGTRATALHAALSAMASSLPAVEALMNAVADAHIRAAALPRDSDPYWMPPLPRPTGEGFLHQLVTSVPRAADRQLLRDLLTARLHAAAPNLRPEGLCQLYTELAGIVQETTPAGGAARQALVDAVVGMHGALTLVQFHEMVHAVAGNLSGDVAACFYDALRAARPPLPPPQVAALAAAITDALLHHTPAEYRDGVTEAHVRALVMAAGSLTEAQRAAAVMGLCSAHARRHGGREPSALKGLKFMLDAWRREAESQPGAARSGASLAKAFAVGLMLALEPERALQPEAWALPLAPQDAPGLLLVAFGMPVKGTAGQVAGGLSELARRSIAPDTANDIRLQSAQGRGLLMEPQALQALHRDLIRQLRQPDDGVDRKHAPAAAQPSQSAPAELTKLLNFYEGLDLAAGVGEPEGKSLTPHARLQLEHGLALFTQCMSDVRKLIQPADPALALGLLSRLATATRNLAERLGVPYEMDAELTPEALLRRMQVPGGPPAPSGSRTAPPLAGRGDRKSEGCTLRQALLGLPDDTAQARKALAPFAMQFASAIEPVTRRSLTREITASAADLSGTALSHVAREIAVAMGGDQLDPHTVGALQHELVSAPTVSADAARAITQGMALGLGGRELPDRMLRALLAAALTTGAQALTHAKQEAVVHALAQVLGPRSHLALIQRITSSGLPAADCQRLRAAIAATQRSAPTPPPARPSSSSN